MITIGRVAACALTAAALLLVPGSAAAYTIDPEANPRWPFDEITYYVGQVGEDLLVPEPATGAQLRAVQRAFDSWNRADIGWRFRRVDSPSNGEADIQFALNPESRFSQCQGVAPRGFGFSQAFVGLRGRGCTSDRLLSLTAAHEIGHVLGLGEERRRCSVMNQKYRRTDGRIRPANCPRDGAQSLVQLDDRRGARVLYRRPFAQRRSLCDPPDELPILANSFLCRYQFDCRGVDGENLEDENGDGDNETRETEDQILSLCRRELRVVSLLREADDARGVPPPDGSDGVYSGLTSGDMALTFRFRDGVMRGLRVNVRYECSDGSRPFSRSDPLRRQPVDHEEIGPFPPMRVRGRRLRRAFETPNQTAIYELRARIEEGSWKGSFRAIEGWGVIAERMAPGQIISEIAPDPDGGFLCDTGVTSFTASRSAR